MEGVHTYYAVAGSTPVLVHNGTGSYTITFSNGMQYVGKGDQARAATSAARIESEYGVTATNTDWSPATTDEESWVQEEYRMRNADGPGGNTYNKINSPGSNVADDLGCP